MKKPLENEVNPNVEIIIEDVIKERLEVREVMNNVQNEDVEMKPV